MFTGIIEATGTLTRSFRTESGIRWHVQAPRWEYKPVRGDSICVQGCCLTHAVEGDSEGLVFDIIPETLARTNLERFREGSTLNLEHAATMSTLLGGHVVQGHVDALAEVVAVQTHDQWRVRLRTVRAAMECIIPKGSVTLDGVSLTVAAVDPAEDAFEVALIPTTLEKTTLGSLIEGSVCNLETDASARTIVHWLKHYRDFKM
ncbi:MAG: riboflavin synthase [Phycisphaerales bacterium]